MSDYQVGSSGFEDEKNFWTKNGIFLIENIVWGFFLNFFINLCLKKFCLKISSG